jgi:hypothetical protein
MTQPIAKILASVILLFIFVSCKKTEIIEPKSVIEIEAKKFLKTQMSEEDLKKLDWLRLREYKKQGKTEIIKIPLIGSNKLEDKVVYLRVVGNSFAGNYFQQEGDSLSSIITTTSFNKSIVGVAKIKNNKFDGKYEVFKDGVLVSTNSLRTTSFVTFTIPVSLMLNYQLHVLIQTLGIGQPGWYPNPPNNTHTTLEYLEPAGDGGNPDGLGGNEEIIEFEIDDPDSKPGVNITQLFNCFDQVPSGPNANFTLRLSSDIPSNKDENTGVVFSKGTVGHSFLSVTKSNGSQSVTQNFGFYPQSGLESLGLGNVPSKIVNDGQHEINASLIMNINEASFNLIKSNAIFEASQPYNLVNNNCAHFAIKLFNLARSNNPILVQNFPVTIQSVLPGLPSLNLNLSNSPQMLYKKLAQMKSNGSPEAANIITNRDNGTIATLSNGECP